MWGTCDAEAARNVLQGKSVELKSVTRTRRRNDDNNNKNNTNTNRNSNDNDNSTRPPLNTDVLCKTWNLVGDQDKDLYTCGY